MTRLLAVTALLEAAAGLALAADPSFLARLLLGAPLDTSAGLAVARIAGAALLALALACWLARDDGPAFPLGMAKAMSLYNLAAAAALAYARVGLALPGVALWPAAVLHAALAGWCLSCLR